MGFDQFIRLGTHGLIRIMRWQILVQLAIGLTVICQAPLQMLASPAAAERVDATASPRAGSQNPQSGTNQSEHGSSLLFDGNTLKGWAEADFAGRGEVKVEKAGSFSAWVI